MKINTKHYAKLPLDLIEKEEFQDLSLSEMVIYSILLDKRNLSEKNKAKYQDNKGIFIFYSTSDLAEYLKIQKKTVVKALKNLEKAGLIERGKQGSIYPDKIYFPDMDIEDVNLPLTDQQTQEIINKLNVSDSLHVEEIEVLRHIFNDLQQKKYITIGGIKKDTSELLYQIKETINKERVLKIFFFVRQDENIKNVYKYVLSSLYDRR